MIAIAALVAWLLWRFIDATDWGASWQLVSGLVWWQITVILLLPLAGHFTNALRWWCFLFVLQAQNHVRLHQLLAYNIAGFATSYLVPSADLSGRAMRAVLIHRKGVATTDAVLSISLELLIGTAIDVVVRALVIFGFGFWWLFENLDSGTLLWTAPLLLILFIIFLIPVLPKTAVDRLVPPAIKNLPHINEFITGLMESRTKLETLRSKPATLAAVIALSILLATIISLELWLITRFLESNAPFVFGFLYSSVLPLAAAFPVVGGVGVLENMMHEVFVALGQPAGLAAVTILIWRFKDLIWVLTGLIILARNSISVFTKNT
jgi:uncharacterized membrane protein YbhN (UPF0104 family)